MHANKRILKDVFDSLVVFLIAVILFIGAIALLCVFGGEIMSCFGGCVAGPGNFNPVSSALKIRQAEKKARHEAWEKKDKE